MTDAPEPAMSAPGAADDRLLPVKPPTPALPQRRRSRAGLILLVVAIGFAGLAAWSWRQTAASGASTAGAPLLPGLASRVAEVTAITVQTEEERYSLVRKGEGWVMPEKGGHPVATGKADAFLATLVRARRAEPRTADPARLDMLGLGDPDSGGSGARIDLFVTGGPKPTGLVIGYKNGRSYAREATSTQAWLLAEADDMPPLHRAARWLDLDVLKVDPAGIQSVTVTPATGLGYALERGEGEDAFALVGAQADWKPVAPFALAGPGLALTRFAPDDVAPAAQLSGLAPVARYSATFVSGMVVNLSLLSSGGQGGRWAKVSATGVAGAQAEADAINARTSGWAYRLPASVAADFSASLADIADPP